MEVLKVVLQAVVPAVVPAVVQVVRLQAAALRRQVQVAVVHLPVGLDVQNALMTIIF